MGTRDHPDWWRPVGGANSIESVLERRFDATNYGGTEVWIAHTGNGRAGKMFPRGMRGFLTVIRVWCRDTAAAGGTITVYLAPYIGSGYLYTANVVVPPGGAAAWRDATFNTFWNYDSMFIWVVCSNANTVVCYAASPPFDGHVSNNAGVTWVPVGRRYWFYPRMHAATAGDVPVSGTLNTIPIPNVSSMNYYAGVAAPNGVETILADVYGAGELDYIFIWWNTAVVPAPVVMYNIYIYIDDQAVALQIWNSLLTQSGVATTGRCAIGAFWQDPTQTYMATWLKLPFRRHLRVSAMQTSGAACAMWGWVVPRLIR